MNYRTLGKTGIEVSEIGYGTWGIGKSAWGDADDAESKRALHRAVDLGLNFIDTALIYGDGHSERLIGEVVRERSETVYVATKIPPKNKQWPALTGVPVEEAFPGEYVLQMVETCLSNLRLEAIDILQFHVWSDEWVHDGDWQEAIEQLKKQGRIKHFGISINDHQPDSAIQLVESGLVDTVQVIYNIFDQSPEDRLFASCERHKVGVIARVPLDEGGLTGKITPDTSFAQGDFRKHYFRGVRKQEVFDRVQQICVDLDIPAEQVAETALRFILSHPAVSTVIPGMRSIRNVERNCLVGDGKGLPNHMLSKLKSHRWIRNFYMD